MKRIGLLVAILLAAVVSFRAAPALASGFDQIKQGMSSVAKDQTIDGSAYLAGDSVTVDGTVKGDVYCAGKDVTIAGTVEGDVLCAGENLTVGGVVKGDIRAAGADITIKGKIDGSLSAAGSKLTIAKEAVVGRDLLGAAAVANIDGSVQRDILIGAEALNIAGTVGRNVEGDVSKLSFDDSAKVGGSVNYSSIAEASVPSGVVAGQVNRTEVKSSGKIGWAMVAMAVFSFVVLTALLALVAPRYVKRVSDSKNFSDLAKFFAIGLVGLVLTPLVVFLLIISVIGAYAAIVLVLAVTLASLLGGSLVAYRLGRFMFSDKQNYFLTAAIGAFALGVICAIPIIGWAVTLITGITGVGMIVVGIGDQNKALERVEKKPVVLAAKKSSSKKS